MRPVSGRTETIAAFANRSSVRYRVTARRPSCPGRAIERRKPGSRTRSASSVPVSAGCPSTKATYSRSIACSRKRDWRAWSAARLRANTIAPDVSLSRRWTMPA